MTCCKPLPKRMRQDAKYCSDHCRYVAHGKRRSRPRWVDRLEEHLLWGAPSNAIGYRLALIRGPTVWWYPPSDRESVRAVGPPRRDRQFALVPSFESPIVPTTDLYGVVLLDGQGRELRTPAELLAGVEARRLRRIKIDDGERGS